MKALKKMSVFLAAFAIMCVGFVALSPAYAEPIIEYDTYVCGFYDPACQLDEETGEILVELVPNGKYGKINFEIVNLIPGRLYSLSFNGNISPSIPAGVVCAVSDRFIGGTYENSTEDIMTTDVNIPWTSNGANSINFVATEETMYFVWGFPLMEIGSATHYMTLSNLSIADLGVLNEHPQTDAPDIYVDYANAILDGFDEPSNTPFGDYTGTVMKLPAVYGRYEKINLPIIGLEPGNSYKLSFTTEINRSLSDENIFGFCISDVEEYDDGEEASQEFSQREGYVEWTENGDYEIEFAATSDVMYLVWDCSKFNNNKVYKMTFSNTSIEWTGIAPLPEEDSEANTDDEEIPEEPVNPFEEYICGDGYIDLEYAEFYGFTSSDNSVHDDYAGTEMNLNTKSGKYEKINIPLECLTVGNEYKLFFMASLNKPMSKSYNMGYVISDTPVTGTDSGSANSLVRKEGYVEWNGSNDMQEIDFTATSEKMYLVWECSKLEDGQSYLMSIDTSFLADLNAHYD